MKNKLVILFFMVSISLGFAQTAQISRISNLIFKTIKKGYNDVSIETLALYKNTIKRINPNTYSLNGRNYLKTSIKLPKQGLEKEGEYFVEFLERNKVDNGSALKLVESVGLKNLNILDRMSLGMDDIGKLKLYMDARNAGFIDIINSNPKHFQSYKKLQEAGMASSLRSNPKIIESLSNNVSPIPIPTINQKNLGKRIDGVMFVEKVVTLPNDIKIKGVFPEFKSYFSIKLPNNLMKATDSQQFEYALRQIRRQVERNPELANSLPKELLTEILAKEIKPGLKSKGSYMLTKYPWHHSEKTGVIELVFETGHKNARHTGGRALWGGGSESRHI